MCIYIHILGSDDCLLGRGLLLDAGLHPGAFQSPRFCEDVLVAPGHHHALPALPHRVVEDPGGAERRTLLDVLLGVGPLPLDELLDRHHLPLRGVDLLQLVLPLARLHDLLEQRFRPSAAEVRLRLLSSQRLVGLVLAALSVTLEAWSEGSTRVNTLDGCLPQSRLLLRELVVRLLLLLLLRELVRRLLLLRLDGLHDLDEIVILARHLELLLSMRSLRWGRHGRRWARGDSPNIARNESSS